MTTVCQQCKRSNGLWRAVAVETDAWQAIEPDKHGDNPGRVEEIGLYRVEVSHVQYYGCSNCGIEGKSRDELLIEIDSDGEKIVKPLPGQERLAI
jgi:hypothetical protein